MSLSRRLCEDNTYRLDITSIFRCCAVRVRDIFILHVVLYYVSAIFSSSKYYKLLSDLMEQVGAAVNFHSCLYFTYLLVIVSRETVGGEVV